MRKIILDTETTGLNNNHNKIIEIGAIETFDNIPSGNFFHVFLDPLMEISNECTAICGITNEMARGKPLFEHIVSDFEKFLGNSPIVAHNAPFDVGFINKERLFIGLNPITNEIIDTLQIARKIFPGMPNNLNALCKRFKVNLSKRIKHGALIDAELLTQVYFFLLEKQNEEFSLFNLLENEENLIEDIIAFNRTPITHINNEELIHHEEIMQKFTFKKN
jgi:DNA polymerase-3 subunit epsilon